LTFEVASIKPSSPDKRAGRIEFRPGGGLHVEAITLKTLIILAYKVREFQVTGGPGWITSDRFDIDARPEQPSEAEDLSADSRQSTDQQRKTRADMVKARLQVLLEERGHLTIRRETKEQQVYALLVAKGGPKLQESQEKIPRMMAGRALLRGQSIEMDFLATELSNQLGRIVIDKTGLPGHYDFELKWTPDPGQPAAAPLPPAPPGFELPPPPDPNGPSIFTALQEQLGLRLESQKAPVEFLVIDHVERPSEN
jgi:uncharacterized protein (TIGR03435 family)